MTWTAKNNGLTGSSLNVNYINIHPNSKNSPTSGHILLIATDGGLYESIDGGENWSKFNMPDPSNDEFSDDPAATADELTYHWVERHPFLLGAIYVIAAKASVSRLWVYKSGNNGVDWVSRGVIAE